MSEIQSLDDSESKTTVIQNISTLDLTLESHSNQPEEHSLIYSSKQIMSKIGKNQEELGDYREKYIQTPEANLETLKVELNDKNLKIISVEIDYLKQSVGYLHSQLHTKSLEITAKNEKIHHLEKTIEKQKGKMKELKTKIKMQEHTLVQLEERLPKYYDLLEKFKVQENCKADLDKKYSQLESMVTKMKTKKTKYTSSSPKPEQQPMAYRVSTPKNKKF
ncbi:hypothetical protein SteCoe_26973 [Stentor coeruleus]|uniref:Uncharacterized protein n=1 Tax=Stentor coeruleus TaxID=5963 RepID=A0A1R2BBL3_9CILI|nr:hypothetical protein SteCoe_26973 [Stentor coeruleus]